ncbi:class I SAM-dependent methyltransferase [Paenibacillus tianjinensis]|uniref:Class I SAM-dependent methyltransferase n=1 Tax=Paenibacillus tianjinensis TaxID=2810347 RepID=A0ABX7L6W1_9BACL|nr:class I SAM-dependent methyltransferase [Paenibacillus tianjinensis]QSF43053.1 class I SAM-dependent methyltransferase [Paenibacillus tianjinensis]
MKNGSWEAIYVEQGKTQIDVLDTVVEAAQRFTDNGCTSILDLGCGTGRHTLFLADQGFHIHASDLSPTGVQLTRQLVDQCGAYDVEYSVQNMYAMTLEDQRFDGVLCIWVQGHGVREDIRQGIHEIHRVLKKGGTVVTDFVTTEDPTYGIGEEIDKNTFVGGRPGEEDIPHYYTTREELETLFAEFSEVELADKVYEFTDMHGNEHKIVAILVTAKK